ncbi:MAG: sarcosine oxidase subunit gamma [Roseobacter sp.]|nr:sarcosine oxidase subunit gamma [Roseobacter sp.]
MVELNARSACDGLLPVTVGDVTMQEAGLGPLTTLSPYKGRQKALSGALKKAHGLGYPAPNETVSRKSLRTIWFGRDTALLVGVAPDETLATYAALTDQSDAWAAVTLTGAGCEDVLARLVPVDLRPTAFGPGHTLRTLLGHMNASLTRLDDGSLLILVFRSMAETLVHEVKEAMEAVAARG